MFNEDRRETSIINCVFKFDVCRVVRVIRVIRVIMVIRVIRVIRVIWVIMVIRVIRVVGLRPAWGGGTGRSHWRPVV